MKLEPTPIVPRTHHVRLSRILLNLEAIAGGYIRGLVQWLAISAEAGLGPHLR